VDRWLRRPDPIPDWRHPALVGWAGMRGVVSLAAAFALPEDMPGRELILFVTFCVILTTLLLQGLTLPWVVRKLGLADSDAQDRLERHVAVADHHVARFALGELERIQHDDPLPDAVESELRGHLEERVRRAHAILGGCPGEDEYDDGVRLEDERSYAESEHVAEVRRQLVDAERGELVRLYNERDINDEVLRRMQRQLDLEELQLHV
jgi:CPA1 family monovalent cation:H+ antiporter